MTAKGTFTSSPLLERGRSYYRVKPSANDQLTQFSPSQQLALQNLVKVGKKTITSFSLSCRLAKGKGVVALFSGPSGTGKTMAAKTLARELQSSLFVIDTSELIHRYIGKTEKIWLGSSRPLTQAGPCYCLMKPMRYLANEPKSRIVIMVMPIKKSAISLRGSWLIKVW